MGLTRAAEDFELDAEGSGYCQRAIDIFTGLASEYPDEPLYRMRLARAYNSFGCANYHVDELEELEIAPGIIDKAIAIYARLVDEYPDEPLYQQGLALAYSNLGCIRSKLEQADLAIDSYRKAISIYESLCADENLILGPTIWQRRISLDSTHNDLYAIKLRQIYNLSSTYQGLLEHLIDDQSTQVTEIKLRLAGIAYLCEFNAKKPIATGIAVGMHFVLDNLSLDYPSPFLDRLATLEHPNFLGSGLIKEFGYEFIDSPPDNLDKCQEEVIKTGERLIRENPSQLSYRAGLAILLREICAKRYERGQVGEAVSIQQKVVEIFKQIYTVHPPMFYSELSGRFHPLGKEYQLLADLQRETGQLEQAAATVQAMITILHSSRSYELPFKYLILADLQEEMGQLDDAIRSRNSCISTYRLNVSGARPWIRSQECYDLACLFSLSSAAVMKDNNLPESKRTKLADKHAAHAMELLKDAGKFSVLDFKFPNQMGGISGSYRPAPPAFLKEPENVAHMKQDPDLDPLRERDDFKKLVKKLEEDLQK
jgi:tetratricopeptide (TPR) repeat protein